jgi:hypothetical protein
VVLNRSDWARFFVAPGDASKLTPKENKNRAARQANDDTIAEKLYGNQHYIQGSSAHTVRVEQAAVNQYPAAVTTLRSIVHAEMMPNYMHIALRFRYFVLL